MNKIICAAVLCGMLLASGLASAALMSTTPACTTGNALTVMNPDAIACIGSYQGSEATQQADVLATMTASFAAQLGDGSWSVLETVDAGASGQYLHTVPGSLIGTIGFAVPLSGVFGLALGMPHQFSVYLFDGTAAPVSSVYFTTAGTEWSFSEIPAGLSHASLYQFDPDGAEPSGIPLPPAFVLLGTVFLLANTYLRCRR